VTIVFGVDISVIIINRFFSFSVSLAFVLDSTAT
jgi:hypothetical protein